MHTVVIGGGIGGLTAAYRLHQRATQRLTVVETSTHWGGVIASRSRDDCLLELGPDAVLTTKPAAIALMRELGLESQVQGTEPSARTALIARGTRLIPVPDGLYLLAPAKLWPFALSPLMSWPGKLRMGLDLLLPRRAAGLPEESLAQFVRRRLGAEALARIAQPMVSGIYSADPEQLSLAATMPQFLDMEREHRSLILAMRARARAQAGQAGAAASGPRYGLFATLRGGMAGLIDALVAKLSAAELRLGSGARSLRREADRWVVTLHDGTVLSADQIVLATPAWAAADLLRPTDAALANGLASVPYASMATINLAFTAEDAHQVSPGAGFVVPAVENRVLLACTTASRKFAGRAPTGTVLLRAVAGGALRAADLELDDDALVAAVLNDLRTLLRLRGAPRWSLVQRWQRAMPQYLLGHRERIAAVRTAEARLPGLALVGNAYEGTGIPDVIAGAEAAVTRLAAAGPHLP